MAQLGESQRLTQLVQGFSLLMSLIYLFLVCFLWWKDLLDVHVVFTLIAVEWMLAIVCVAWNLNSFPSNTSAINVKSVAKEFYEYCAPLIPYTWVGFLYQFSDRWLLQAFGGPIEQAYYSIGAQFGVVSLIATQSILNIFWKEIAEANDNGNIKLVTQLYRQVARSIFFVSAMISFFFLPWVEDIIFIVLGQSYSGGYWALFIMLLYPIYQSMGQIVITMMYATARVKAQVIIGILFMVTSIVVTYFVLAPENAEISGYGLGSAGLAGKMLVMAFLSVNFTAFYLARSLQISFDWSYQLPVLLICSSSGWVAHLISNWIFGSSLHVLLCIIVSGFVYLLFLASAVFFKPSLIGTSRHDITYFLRKFKI
jgi:O-antigen/teichoic acid export membrane protein